MVGLQWLARHSLNESVERDGDNVKPFLQSIDGTKHQSRESEPRLLRWFFRRFHEPSQPTFQC
jgi:hypothetical protein